MRIPRKKKKAYKKLVLTMTKQKSCTMSKYNNELDGFVVFPKY